MPLDLYLAYCLAATIILVIPGPTILLVVSQSLAHGRPALAASVLGVTAGDALAVTVSLAGMGAILAASATAFTVLKWLGAAYLVYLAVRMWRSAGALKPLDLPQASRRRIFMSAFVVTALNPKGIVFFVAFLPQFVDPTRPLLPQLLLLGATFVVLGSVNSLIYGLLANRLRQGFRNPRMLGLAQRCGAGFLFSAGVMTAAMQRS